MTLRTLNSGNYGIFLIMGNAGFCPSTVFRVYRAIEPRVKSQGSKCERGRKEGFYSGNSNYHGLGESRSQYGLQLPR